VPDLATYRPAPGSIAARRPSPEAVFAKAKVDMEVIHPSGESQTMHLDIPEAIFGGENGFATFYLAIRAISQYAQKPMGDTCF
jgi:hypothetical protein